MIIVCISHISEHIARVYQMYDEDTGCATWFSIQRCFVTPALSPIALLPASQLLIDLHLLTETGSGSEESCLVFGCSCDMKWVLEEGREGGREVTLLNLLDSSICVSNYKKNSKEKSEFKNFTIMCEVSIICILWKVRCNVCICVFEWEGKNNAILNSRRGLTK